MSDAFRAARVVPQRFVLIFDDLLGGPACQTCEIALRVWCRDDSCAELTTSRWTRWTRCARALCVWCLGEPLRFVLDIENLLGVLSVSVTLLSVDAACPALRNIQERLDEWMDW